MLRVSFVVVVHKTSVLPLLSAVPRSAGYEHAYVHLSALWDGRMRCAVVCRCVLAISQPVFIFFTLCRLLDTSSVGCALRLCCVVGGELELAAREELESLLKQNSSSPL